MAPMTDKAPLLGLQSREKSQDETVKSETLTSPTTSEPPSRKTSTQEIVSCFRSGGSINVPRKISQGPLQSFIPKGGPTMENVQDEIKARFRRGYSKVKAVNSFKDKAPLVKKTVKAQPETPKEPPATHQGTETTNTERQTTSVINQKSHQATNPSTIKLVNVVDPLINGPSYVRESALPNPIAQDYIAPTPVTKKSTLHIQHNAKTLQPENSDSDQPNSLPPFENQSYEGASSSSSSLPTSSSHPLRTLHQTSSNDPNLNLSSITVPAQNLSPSEIGDRSENSEFEPAKSVQVAINQMSEKEEEKVQKPEPEDDKLDEEIKPVKDIIVKRKPKLQKVETFESANELTPSPLAQTSEHDECGQERKPSLGNGMQVQNPGTAKIDRSHRLSTANSFDSNHSKHSEDLSEHININKDEALSQAQRESSHSRKAESSKMMEDQKADKLGKTTREDNGKLKSPSPMTSIQEKPTCVESVGSLAGIAEYPNASQVSFISPQNDSMTNQGKVTDSGGGSEPFRPTTASEGVSRRRKFSEEFKARAQDREKRVSRLEEIRQMERDLEPNKRSEEGMDERDIPPEAEARSCSKHSRCHCYLFSIPNAFRMYGMIS